MLKRNNSSEPYNGAGTLGKRQAQALNRLKNNPASDWVEETVITGLNMYDMYSEPRNVFPGMKFVHL